MQHAKFVFKWPFSGVTRGCVTSSKGSLLEKMEQVFAGWMLFLSPSQQCKCFEGNSEQSADFNQWPLSTTGLLGEEAVVFFMWAFQCCM